MISEIEIQEWWTRKIENYLKNYAKINKLAFRKVRTKFFIETHEKKLETNPTKMLIELSLMPTGDQQGSSSCH